MNNEFLLRKVTPEDFETVMSIYKSAILDMDKKGIHQWDDIYPSEQIINNDISNRSMFLCGLDNQIASVFVLNQEYDEEYIYGNWHYNNIPFYVVHKLCVNPAFQGNGVGTATMLLIENYLHEMGIAAIRLDAFSQNPIALKMYEKLGYTKIGEVTWRKGLFYLFEKKI